MDFKIHLLLSTTFLLLLFSLNLELLAAVKVSQASGNWSNSEVWGGAVPAANDDIIISSGTTVHVNVFFTESMVFNSVAIMQGGSLVVGANDVKLRIKGNISNDGTINFWQSSTYQADIFLYGNSVWSGAGSWNLSNINVQGYSLEPAQGLTLTVNGSITAYPGSSFNKINRYPNITINIQGTLNTMISSYPDFYYGHLVISKTTGTVSFSPSTSFNLISFSGDLTLTNSTDRLIVEAYNTLTLNGRVMGAGLISGSSTSSLVVDNLNAPAINPLRILSGTHFRDFIVNRQAGVTLSNGFVIRESLQLNNACRLTLPPQTLTLGINGTNPTSGSLFGDGTFIGSNNSSLSIRGKDTASVRLRFDQTTVASYTLNNLIVDKQAGKVVLEAGNLIPIGKLEISDRNIFAIGAGNLIINIIPKFIGSGCLGGSKEAGLTIGGTSLVGYPLIFDQLTPFGNSLKTYTQSRNATITLANKMNISERINLTGNSSVLVSNGNLTLLSSPDGSAGISSLLNSADVKGDVNVQVFISGDSKNLKYRGFRSLSTPINDDLIALNNKKSLAQLKDYIIVTGPGGPMNGFDPGGAAQPYAQTLLFYNPLALRGQSLFAPIENINESLTQGSGFFAFFRGKQMGSPSLNLSKLNSPFIPPEPVTIVYKGTINKFDIPVVLHSSQDSSDEYKGYNLIGNPYPSAIDWTKIERSPGVNNEVVILKPGGGAATYLNGFSNNGGTPYIQTGQGFYVRTAVDGSTITFKENCKTTSYPARFLNGPSDDNLTDRTFSFSNSERVKTDYEVIRLNMGAGLDKDETTIVFTAGERPEADYNDAMYFGGTEINLASLSSDGKRTAISFMPDIRVSDTINLYVNAVNSGVYVFNFTDVPRTVVDIFLKDAQSGVLTQLKKDLSYQFEIDKSNPATFGYKRFSLIFQKSGKEKFIPGERPLIDAYPNPVSNEVFFNIRSLPEQSKKVIIYDIQGKIRESLVFKRKDKVVINVNWFEPGLYVAKFRSEEDGKVLGEAIFIKY